MQNIKDALLRMYRVAKMAQKYEKAMDPYESPFTEIYGNAADAIYYLLGEKTELFTESETFNILNTVSLTEDRAVELLMNEYKKNTVEYPMPKPWFTPRRLMKERAEEGNGYVSPEGDWE